MSGTKKRKKKDQTLPPELSLGLCPQSVSKLWRPSLLSLSCPSSTETGASRSLVIGVDLSPLGTPPQLDVIVSDDAGILTRSGRRRRFFSVIVVVVVLTLGEDQIAAAAEDLPAGLLEEDPKRDERRLVHATLIRTAAAATAAVPCVVKGARVAVDGLEEVALWKHALAATGEPPLVGVVDVVLQVAPGGVLATKEDLVGRQGNVLGGISDGLGVARRVLGLFWLCPGAQLI